MFAPEAPGGGAGWANEVERWLLFRCRNSQERSSVTVREGPVRQFWPPQVYQPATRVARAVACDRDERFRPVLAARRGQPRSRRGGHVWRRAGWILQLRGEISLQIRCRCSEAQSPLQSMIALGQPASGHRGCPEIGVCSRCSQPDSHGSSPAIGVVEAGRASDQEI
jgi:hypothetical protein